MLYHALPVAVSSTYLIVPRGLGGVRQRLCGKRVRLWKGLAKHDAAERRASDACVEEVDEVSEDAGSESRHRVIRHVLEVGPREVDRNLGE